MVSFRGHPRDDDDGPLITKNIRQVAWDYAILLPSHCVSNSDAHNASMYIKSFRKVLGSVNLTKYYVLGVPGGLRGVRSMTSKREKTQIYEMCKISVASKKKVRICLPNDQQHPPRGCCQQSRIFHISEWSRSEAILGMSGRSAQFWAKVMCRTSISKKQKIRSITP